ncbi:PfWMP4_07 [Phormidium phage Pf-WMP4]|uniref:PfWMP4_07 n=1 Tax=Phormidium phage Pf-WMP4 TaxID=2913979 RepID=Q0GBV9_9CAUD|nr:PfWMP4_07 [Phormidium phage Pf-WMP4]ABI33151.1 PfWMP4_07 [Phormidium phage Pf-WMP4]
MANFNSIFQNRVEYLGIEPMGIAEIGEALRNSYLHQFEVNASRVETLGKDIIKQAQLWQLPRLVFVVETQTWILGGGRHRLEAVSAIVDNYGVNASGKLVKLDSDGTDLEVDSIEPVINVEKFRVQTTKDLVQFLQTDNGSRSMTAAEKIKGKEESNSLTPAENLKLILSKALTTAMNGKSYVFTRTDKDGRNEDVSVVPTADAIRQVSIKLAGLVGTKFKYATRENLTTLATAFEKFLDETSESYDSNFTRLGHKEAVESFASLEHDGVLLNADGEEIEDATYLDWFRTQIKTPQKKTKISDMADKLARLQAKLSELGVDVDL